MVNEATRVARYVAAAPANLTVLQCEAEGDRWEWFGPNSALAYLDEDGEYFGTELEAWQSAFRCNKLPAPAGEPRRYSVPVTIVATIIVDADGPDAARREAVRFAEAMENDGHFKDGWNDIQRENGGPLIHAVSSFDVENVELAEIEAGEIGEDE